MNKTFLKISLAAVVFLFGSIFCQNFEAMAEDGGNKAATSISISPVSKILQLEPDTSYENTFTVTNNGDAEMRFEVYAAPYSYVHDEEQNTYKLGFNQENNYTQIVRWITFKNTSGSFVEKAEFVAEPNSSVEVTYQVSTPSSLPAGGQYAVLFAHTLSGTTNANGIRTEASPGLVLYGRANGETNLTGEISDLKIEKTLKKDNDVKNIINASAKIANKGNVDFMASGVLKVQGIFGRAYYETPDTRGRISVIPETELSVTDQWDETPYFGFFKVTWTVSAAGQSEVIEQTVLILPPPILVGMILLLTIIIVWIIIMVRKRKERRSRFMVQSKMARVERVKALQNQNKNII